MIEPRYDMDEDLQPRKGCFVLAVLLGALVALSWAAVVWRWVS